MKANHAQRFEYLYSELMNPNGRTMAVVHRGDWHHAPENSLPAIRNAIDLGVDMIEIDVRSSRDGWLILMHDETVDRMTDGKGAVADLSYEELRALRLKHSQGGEGVPLTEERIPNLLEVMNLVKGKALINLDKCWNIREEVYRVLLESGTVDHALFKSDADLGEVEAFLASKPIRPLYMHIVHPANSHLLSDVDALITKIEPQAVEFIFEDEAHPFVAEDAFLSLAGKCRIWMNAMWDELCGGHSDERSFSHPEQGWGWGLSRKVNMIQTDHSLPLLRYLQSQA